MTLKGTFIKTSQTIAALTGHPYVFIGATALIVTWAASGPLFGYSDGWQLVVNTSTTIITFLMVFLIQSTQNRDTGALHLKLDELIRATQGAHLALMDIETLEEDEFQAFCQMYKRIASEARERLDQGKSDINCPDIEMKPLEAEVKIVEERNRAA